MDKNILTFGVMKKLSQARKQLKDCELKKSGRNKHAGFNYFELGDFLPQVQEINANVGLVTQFLMGKDECILRVYDVDDCSSLDFNVDRVEAEVKMGQKIQSLGATQTYMRRYCYLSAYEISENDTVDALPQENTNNREQKFESKKQEEQTKKPTDEERKLECIKFIKEHSDKAGITCDVEELKKKTLKEVSIVYKNLVGGVK